MAGLDRLSGETRNRRNAQLSCPVYLAPFNPSHPAPRRYRMAAINTETKGEIVVIYFTDGKILDSQRIEQVGRELQEAVPQAIHKKLVLNFRGVSFMSSAMITKLVMLNKSCKTQGVALKFCDLSTNVMEVFKITKLNKLFDIHKTEEKAIESFDKKGWFG
jgi:anti-anti-sigma factor